jgi:hypothetical protein
MRRFPAIVLLAVLAGCASGGAAITSEVEATHLANVRKINLFTPSLLGEEGVLFNSLLREKLTNRLAAYIHPGARWTLTILAAEYTRPDYKQSDPYYKLMLEAELTDINGKQGQHVRAGATETVAGLEQTAEQEAAVRVRLVETAVDTLVSKLPLTGGTLSE